MYGHRDDSDLTHNDEPEDNNITGDNDIKNCYNSPCCTGCLRCVDN